MSNDTKRDPLLDPQPGDVIYLRDNEGLKHGHKGMLRRVVRRVRNDIYYVNKTGKERNCWITTWLDWCRSADIERVETGEEQKSEEVKG